MLKRFMPVFLCMAIVCSWMMFPNPSAHADPEIGNVYYVDSISGSDDNDGKSEVNAWKTLDIPNATVFQPGDKLLFKTGGIWNGQLRPLGSGAEGQPIIIDKYGSGDMPIINGNGTMGETVLKEAGTVMLVDQEYWEINNLEVTNFSDTVISSRVGILAVSNSTAQNHIYIRNNYVHDVNSHWNGSKSTGGILILGLGGFHDVLIENNHVKNVAIEGIRTANGSGRVNQDVVIRNNYIEEVLGDGIVLTSIAQGGLVENNVVKNFANTYVGSRNYAGIWSFVADNTVFQYNEAFGGKYGFNDGEGYDIDMNCYNSLFQYNYSHNNRGGFALFMGSSQKSVFRYNVSVNDGKDSEIFFYLPNYVVDAPEIYNNTIITGASSGTKIFRSSGSGATMKFYNNLIYGGLDVTFANYPPKGEFANNSVYPATILETNGPAIHPGLVTANPKIANPWVEVTGIANTSGYKLKADSPLIDAGKVMSNNGGTDFFGNTLYNGLPDIGAHEYTDDPGPTPEPIPVTSMTLNKPQLSLYVGDTDSLTATLTPETIYDKGITWSSSDTSIVQISPTGLVKALAVGTATITGTSDYNPSFTAQSEVTVSNLPTGGVFSPTSDTFARNGAFASDIYGSIPYLYIKNDVSGYMRKAYMQFDTRLLSYNDFQSAKLRLYVTAADGYRQRAISVYATSSNWTESGLRWSNAPSGTELVGQFPVPNGVKGSWIVLDISDYMLAHKDDEAVSFVITNDIPFIQPNQISNIQFGSKESANGPQLIIDPVPVPKPVTSLTLNKTQLSLIVGETPTLTATLLPGDVYDPRITWSSSNPSIVQVSSTGQLKALAAGTATITVTSVQNPSFTAQSVVTVSDVPTEGVFAPAADAFVRNGASGNDNYGSIPYLYIKNDASGYARKSYIKFDTSLLSYNDFDSAKLRLYVQGVTGYAQRTITVSAATYNWLESGIRWNNAPASEDLVGKVPVPNEAVGSWIVLDISDYMLAHKNDGFVSFVLTNDDPTSRLSDIQFGSRESANGPQLIIDPAPVPTPVTSLTLNKTQLPLLVGETQTLTATLLPAEVPDKGITWSSSNSSIVQVSPTGQLKALAVGTATITATSTQDPSVMAQSEVTVSDVPTVGVLAPTADSFVRNGTSGYDNYGTIPYLYIKNDASGYARKAYMKFDTSLLSYNDFNSAKLRLYVTTADGYAQRSVSVSASTYNWTESGINWNNAPASADLVGQIPVPNGSVGSWVILDITDYLQDHKNDGVVSFVLTNAEPTSNIQFGSRESANGPQLIIDPAPVPTPVTSLTLNKTQLPLFVGETQTLTATLLPAEVPDKGITWSSSDSSIVQVSPTGQLKALAEGTATITVTSTQDPSFTAQCIVIVLDVPTEGIIAPTADSFVRNGASGNDNYGTIPYLYIKNDASGYARKAYMKFDTSLLPGSGFDFAKLRLYVTTADGYAQRTVSVYATSSDWTESGIKWNNGPASADLVGQIPVPNGSLGSWVILDLTDYMLAHRNDGFVSFVLTNDQSGSTLSNIQFGSKESANGPQLIVN